MRTNQCTGDRMANLQLSTGSRVAIIGGGPAGCFFALYLQRYARERGIQQDVTIYEPREFNDKGIRGCKGCAGILSASLLKNLSELGLTLPKEVIRNRIERYVVHSPYTTISLSNPDPSAQIISVYRGGGPRESDYIAGISFDGWLLEQARIGGAGGGKR